MELKIAPGIEAEMELVSSGLIQLYIKPRLDVVLMLMELEKYLVGWIGRDWHTKVQHFDFWGTYLENGTENRTRY